MLQGASAPIPGALTQRPNSQDTGVGALVYPRLAKADRSRARLSVIRLGVRTAPLRPLLTDTDHDWPPHLAREWHANVLALAPLHGVCTPVTGQEPAAPHPQALRPTT
jgi:hypothetical protein